MALLVGVDCATEDTKIGLARARLRDGDVRLEHALICGKAGSAADLIAQWILDADGPVLLAVDAPLGWPARMGRALIDHVAGEAIDIAAHELFRRATDRFVRTTLGKTPLDVGADRIARTAHSALRLLASLRSRTSQRIPLAWSPIGHATVSAIEVYPAATLVSHGCRSGGYKRPDQDKERRELLSQLSSRISCDGHSELLCKSADVLDALVCVLAAMDFIQDRCLPPAEQELARQEGWIWFADPRLVRGDV